MHPEEHDLQDLTSLSSVSSKKYAGQVATQLPLNTIRSVSVHTKQKLLEVQALHGYEHFVQTVLLFSL